MEDPPWLENLLETEFYSNCPTHGNKLNLFCLDCNNRQALCPHCRAVGPHTDHVVLTIRRNSGQCALRVPDVANVLDVSGVQTYVLGGYDVVYIRQRPHTRRALNAKEPHECEICRRFLTNDVRFCSLGCKLARIRGNANTPASSSKRSREDITSSTTAEESATKRGRRDEPGDDDPHQPQATRVN